jgi:hypothetical protein
MIMDAKYQKWKAYLIPAGIFLGLTFIMLQYYNSVTSPAPTSSSYEKISLISLYPELEASIFANIRAQNISLSKQSSRAISVDGDSCALPRIVVSISTLIGRLKPLESTISSLLHQTLLPDIIYIHIPILASNTKNSLTELKESLQPQLDILRDLEERYHDHVIFHFIHGVDYGPSMKLIGSLQLEKDPETIIITMDDDSTYDARVIQQLIEESCRRPNNSICTCCEIIVSNPKHKSMSWDGQTWQGECHGWIKGFQGAVYRIKWFQDNHIVNDYQHAPYGCHYHDDVWISGILRQHGVKPWMIKSDFPPVIKHVRDKYLSINSLKNRVKYQEDCIKYFDSFRFDPEDRKWQQHKVYLRNMSHH